MAHADSLVSIEAKVSDAIKALHGLEAIAQSTDPDNDAIPLCLTEIVNSFEQIQACEASVSGVKLPREVIESVDRGSNPDAFLAQLAEQSSAACRATLGKTIAMDALAQSVQRQAQECGLLAPVPQRTADPSV
mmetsp:Transcript_18072/g.36788  ORF Transcript_18072/g.36788 Transcript_18072/m.36788 type:complete len:133 (+) Transcript_18072:47-445(+)|eukprot:CAMPEP_0119065484 /NCGR_PEP_ID=MMETSP1178-20130426/8293_1 /TAXON_ID=33656 /ORGANISM="unid sp, Strain CCMP2000" /LENGTH=132 /DNA_ID=CAMNT_0007047009 /DNA_START=47 /DNA_END=445 /DNA_ORIENTATION=-